MSYAISADNETYFGDYPTARDAEGLSAAQVAEACGCEGEAVRAQGLYWVGERVEFRPTADVDAIIDAVACQADNFGEWGMDWVNEQLAVVYDEDERGKGTLQAAFQQALDRWLDDNGIRPRCYYVVCPYQTPLANGGEEEARLEPRG